ncbi:hypothetical protein PVAP13_2KG227605 [Panicum virgatum]|uniref:Uncharacterized protein n=1 Tax=Panicum virgatum TaxID=38727 RepID=A0A8T0WFI0_PANVG|nr:hypothetical protein PVAP13_2KG227605 [Panicum virgatum]
MTTTAVRPSPSRTRRRRASPRPAAEFRPRLHDTTQDTTQLTSSPSNTSASTPWLPSFSPHACMKEFCTSSWASHGLHEGDCRSSQ